MFIPTPLTSYPPPSSRLARRTAMVGGPAGVTEQANTIPHGLWHPHQDKRLICYKPGTKRLLPRQK